MYIPKYLILFMVTIILITYISKIEKFSEEKISVIILNYKRPHNLKKSINKILKIRQVDEIIVANGNIKHKFKINHPNIKCIDDWENNNKYFTIRKFKNHENCKNNIILSIDDDIIPSQELVDNLLKEYKKDPNNFYGIDARKCDDKGYHYFENCDEPRIILTNLFLTNKLIIKNVFENMKKNKKFFNKVIEQKGNCEDILFSKEFTKLYKKYPKKVEGKKKNLDTKNGFSTTNFDEHIKMRDKYCKLLN